MGSSDLRTCSFSRSVKDGGVAVATVGSDIGCCCCCWGIFGEAAAAATAAALAIAAIAAAEGPRAAVVLRVEWFGDGVAAAGEEGEGEHEEGGGGGEDFVFVLFDAALDDFLSCACGGGSGKGGGRSMPDILEIHTLPVLFKQNVIEFLYLDAATAADEVGGSGPEDEAPPPPTTVTPASPDPISDRDDPSMESGGAVLKCWLSCLRHLALLFWNQTC